MRCYDVKKVFLMFLSYIDRLFFFPHHSNSYIYKSSRIYKLCGLLSHCKLTDHAFIASVQALSKCPSVFFFFLVMSYPVPVLSDLPQCSLIFISMGASWGKKKPTSRTSKQSKCIQLNQKIIWQDKWQINTILAHCPCTHVNTGMGTLLSVANDLMK